MSLLFDTQYLFVRSMKKLVRNPILLFFSLFQPVIFLLLFTQLFSRFGDIQGFPAGNYRDFAIAGIVLQNAFSSAFASGTAVVSDIQSGYLEKMLATPVSRPAILLGRILSDVFRVIVQSLIILGLAYLLGTSIATGLLGLLVILLTISFFGIAWSGISLYLGLKTKNAETVFGIAGTVTFPLLFMSTALTPLKFLPEWMKTVSQYNPVSYTVEAIRGWILSPPFQDLTAIFPAYGVIALIGAITIGATLYQFRKVVS